MAKKARGPIAYIAMEFVAGGSCAITSRPTSAFPLKEIERIMVEMLDALQHAHERGVIHRDMKPANVILLDNGAVKVADFGIARLETSDLTQAGAVLGTPAYMSPEQFLGQPVDNRSDLFSCGVILYQFLTGEKPFTGNVTTIMYKVLSEEPLAPSMLNTTLPPIWDVVVRKAMAKKVDERYQSAAEFAAAIRAAAARHGADATVIGAAPEAAIEATAAALTPATQKKALDPTAKLERQAAPAAAPPPTVSPTPSPPSPPTDRSAQGAAAPRPAAAPKGMRAGVLAAIGASVAAVIGAGVYLLIASGEHQVEDSDAAVPIAQSAPAGKPTPEPADAPVAAPAVVDIPVEPGTMIISALGFVNPKDPRFNGNEAAAMVEARADARRQLVDKALNLYVERGSLDRNYALIERKLLADPGPYIQTVLSEGAAQIGKDGLIAAEARAMVKVRAVQTSLNEMSRQERVELIRRGGDPRIAVLMTIRNADTAEALPPERSLLAENVLKERIRSFGFRTWAADGELKTGPETTSAEFQIHGEVKVKLLSMRLAASGLTVSKTALTSWTIKAIDRATGEEIYLNTTVPKGRSWASEDQALVEIGRLVGEEFSRNFFLQHINAGDQKVSVSVTGLPAGDIGATIAHSLLREFRSVRRVLDVRPLAGGRFELRLPEGNAADLIQDAVLEPLNAKLGRSLLPAGRRGRRRGQCRARGHLRGRCHPRTAGNRTSRRVTGRSGSTRQGSARRYALDDAVSVTLRGARTRPSPHPIRPGYDRTRYGRCRVA
jgi:eukaryotic-like serine/threonine-protein kinase